MTTSIQYNRLQKLAKKTISYREFESKALHFFKFYISEIPVEQRNKETLRQIYETYKTT